MNAAGVHERCLDQIERDRFKPVAGELVDRRGELTDGRDVEITTRHEHDPLASRPHVDGERFGLPLASVRLRGSVLLGGSHVAPRFERTNRGDDLRCRDATTHARPTRNSLDDDPTGVVSSSRWESHYSSYRSGTAWNAVPVSRAGLGADQDPFAFRPW